VSLMTKTQVNTVPPAARERARQVAGQLGTVAKSSRDTAASRVLGARTWAAPRIERAGQTVQESIAPRVAAILAATAQRVDPLPLPLDELSRGTRRQVRRAREAVEKAAQMAASEMNARRDKLLAQGTRRGPLRSPAVIGVVMAFTVTAGTAAYLAARRARDAARAAELEAASVAEEAREERVQSRSEGAEAGFDGRVRAR
jgi:hypothetical protein